MCYIFTLFHCELKCTLNSQTHTDKVCLPLYTLSNTCLAMDGGKAGQDPSSKILHSGHDHCSPTLLLRNKQVLKKQEVCSVKLE